MKDEIACYEDSCDISAYAIDNEKVLFAYKEDEIHDAACTLKVFIMLDYVRQLNEKTITGTELVEVEESNYATGAGTVKFLSNGMKICVSDLVELMVAISDHMAANLLIDFLGADHINQTIRMFGFEKSRLLKKYIVPRSFHIGITTAKEYTRLFQMIDNNEFYNEESCCFMKKILKSQRYKDFLAEPLFEYSDFIDMYSKSGKVDGRTFAQPVNSCVNDGGICVTKTGNYYISFLSEIHYDTDVKMEDMKKLMHKISRKIIEDYLEQ